MYALGIDIGTTTFSAVLVDISTGDAICTRTEPNDSTCPGAVHERLQDPEHIWLKAKAMTEELLTAHPGAACIGLTGQMHGILYTDARGVAVSPLFTWQDGRGDLPAPSGETYAQALSRLTGKQMATGYGAVTHYYNVENGLVPKDAVWVMTIADYVGLWLTGRTEPLIHASNVHSLGAPDWPGLSEMIRQTHDTACIGETDGGVPVAVAIGDNQASFIGSVHSAEDSVLVNMGTGGQISVSVGAGVHSVVGVEARPYVDGRTLLVGFSLCGGQAYALLERLFRDIAALAGPKTESMYEQMNALAELTLAEPVRVDTRFCGTRQDPSKRGAIRFISGTNLTPAHLVQGTLQGMVDELHEPFGAMSAHMCRPPLHLIGSGNGIRQNQALRRLFERTFGMSMSMPAHSEEAAYGAALFAMAASGTRKSIADAQRLIRYTRAN